MQSRRQPKKLAKVDATIFWDHLIFLQKFFLGFHVGTVKGSERYSTKKPTNEKNFFFEILTYIPRIVSELSESGLIFARRPWKTLYKWSGRWTCPKHDFFEKITTLYGKKFFWRGFLLLLVRAHRAQHFCKKIWAETI